MKRSKNFYAALPIISLLMLPLLAGLERDAFANKVELTEGSSALMSAERALISARNDRPDSPKRVVYVQKGDTITITAEEDDTWTLGPSADRECNADGCQKFGLYRGFRYGALIGRIGDSQGWFLLGTNYSAKATITGYLYLACHDYPYDDNQGSISVKVEVTR